MKGLKACGLRGYVSEPTRKSRQAALYAKHYGLFSKACDTINGFAQAQLALAAPSFSLCVLLPARYPPAMALVGARACRRKPAQSSRPLVRFAGWREAGADRDLWGANLTTTGMPVGAFAIHDNISSFGYCNRYENRYSSRPVLGGASALRPMACQSASPLEVPVYRTIEHQQVQIESGCRCVVTSPNVLDEKLRDS